MLLNNAIITTAILSSAYALCTTRNVTVQGQLYCGDIVAENVKIQLREYDLIDEDDTLNETRSDAEGKFWIYGEECEIGRVEPYLRIEHECDNGIYRLVIYSLLRVLSTASQRMISIFNRSISTVSMIWEKSTSKMLVSVTVGSALDQSITLKMLLNNAIITTAILSSAYALCTTKNVTVEGQLFCGPLVAQNVKIQLREYDLIDRDDTLNETKSDHDGKFSVYGEECEIGKVEPYLRIEHNCDMGKFKENRVITDDIFIDQTYLGTVYDMGSRDLNNLCINHKRKYN
uniref:Transthyretin-like family protein n=1 Tax=Ascaris lumbricoides TaxID=6252 RepID=A0A0M3I0P0_ASCLU